MFAQVALFLLDGLLKNFVIHLLMTLSVSMTSVFFVHASNSPGADNSILSGDIAKQNRGNSIRWSLILRRNGVTILGRVHSFRRLLKPSTEHSVVKRRIFDCLRWFHLGE